MSLMNTIQLETDVLVIGGGTVTAIVQRRQRNNMTGKFRKIRQSVVDTKTINSEVPNG